MDGRRVLHFDRLDQVLPEVERLLGGHVAEGAWSLGQILHHLASSIRFSLDSELPSTAQPPGPEQERGWDVRRRRFFQAGRFPEGVKIPFEPLIPPHDADERVWAESLGSAIRLLEGIEGRLPAHPVLGPLAKAEWVEFHRLHCIHHLGFVRPIDPEAGPKTP